MLAVGWSECAAAYVMLEFPIPTSSSSPCGITSGSDGALWLTKAVGVTVTDSVLRALVDSHDFNGDRKSHRELPELGGNYARS